MTKKGNPLLRILAATAIVLATAAPAQVTSYKTNNPAPIKSDAHKIACKKVETIGTRLGAKKVCLTVAEWEVRAKEDRDQTERVQSGARVCANPPCPS